MSEMFQQLLIKVKVIKVNLEITMDNGSISYTIQYGSSQKSQARGRIFMDLI